MQQRKMSFYEKYIKYGEEHQDLPISKRGLSYNELLALTEK